jgi:glycosyltransferase involved in cell wall biosynthesis
MKFLIIEPEPNGHYVILYIKFIIRILSKKKHQLIFLTTRKAVNHKSFKIILQENPNIKIEYIRNVKPKNYTNISLIIYQIKLFFILKKAVNKIYKKYHFDHIFLNSIDHIDKAMAFFGDPFKNIKFSGILVNPKFHLAESNLGHSGRFNFFAKMLFKRLLRINNLMNILTNDYWFIKYTKDKNYDNYHKIHYLCEPREFRFNYKKIIARKKLNFPLNSILILVYGALKESKGIKELINIFKSIDINKNIKIVIAGQQDIYTKNLLKKQKTKNLISQNKILILDSFLDDKQEGLLFSSVDLVWVAYRKNFPFLSGVLYQAAVKNLPILACNHGIINNMNKKYKLGFSVDIENLEQLVKKINKICEKKNYNRFVKNSKALAKKANPIFFMKQTYQSLIK